MTARIGVNEENAVTAKSVAAKCEVGEKRKMTFSKIVILYMLGGLVGTVWETLLNLARGRGFVYCNGSIFTPFNFV